MLSSEQVFTFTGSDQYYYTQGHTQFLVKAYGAGGGNFLRSGTEGGVGGYAEAVIIVPAGTDRLTVVVGEAGATWGDDSSPDPCYHNAFGGGGRSACDSYNTAGSGGGRSSVRLDGEDILTAGGGGGGSGKWAASVECKGPGGSGGGEAGGTDCDSSLLSGRGGTASAGGAGGVGIERTGGAGGKYKGGDGSSSSGWSGGGGGGGYYGGGAGGGQHAWHGSGGGGSGFAAHPSVVYSGVDLVTGGGALASTNGNVTIMVYSPTPIPTAPPQVSAFGDPHLTNVYGERFDLMRQGKVLLISIPRGKPVDSALLVVQAEVRRMGEQCADMYFQRLNITGAWADEAHAGGLTFDAKTAHEAGAGWAKFGPLELRVAHGRTAKGITYLNFYAKHLGKAGFAVGGLLGEDDHTEASTPEAKCGKQGMSLSRLFGTTRVAPSSAPSSVATASLD